MQKQPRHINTCMHACDWHIQRIETPPPSSPSFHTKHCKIAILNIRSECMNEISQTLIKPWKHMSPFDVDEMSQFGWNTSIHTCLQHSIRLSPFRLPRELKEKGKHGPLPSNEDVLGLSHFDFHCELHPSVASSNQHLQAVPFTLKAQQQHLSLDFGFDFDFIHSCATSSNHHLSPDGRTDGRGHLQVHRRPPGLSLLGLFG